MSFLKKAKFLLFLGQGCIFLGLELPLEIVLLKETGGIHAAAAKKAKIGDVGRSGRLLCAMCRRQIFENWIFTGFLNYLYGMKPLKLAILLYVKVPFSIEKAELEPLFSQIAKRVNALLKVGKLRFSLFLPGRVAEVWNRRNIADVVEMRNAIHEGNLEILGGGFFDPMLPLFPTELQKLQLRKLSKQLERIFRTEPVGYFNSSMSWEIAMTEVLAEEGFRYTLVSERSLQETLGLATRATGWFTTEDRDSVMQLLPVAEDLSEAVLLDSPMLRAKLESLGESENTWTLSLAVPVTDAASIDSFFDRLQENLTCFPFVFWTLSHLLEEPSGGKVNLMSDIGNGVGLPDGSRSCRELLLRRPEADLLHKSLLIANSHAEALLGEKEVQIVREKLLPVMAPEYYADLYDRKGIRSPEVRWDGNRQIIAVEREIEKLARLDGRRIEVSDFLRNGYRQILANNPDLQFLLEQCEGASLRSLIYKPAQVNLVSSLQQSGDIPRAFVDHLLAPSVSELKQVDSALNDGLGILDSPYDYQIERREDSLGILLRSEQMADIESERHVLHVEKEFSLKRKNSAMEISYTLSNGTFSDLNAYFGSELNLGFRRLHGKRAYDLKIDGKKIPLENSMPLLYPSASEIVLKDGLLSYAFRFRFSRPASVALNWIMGSHLTAAPTVVQGIRLFVFWNLSLTGQKLENLRIRMDFSRRGFFL